MMGRAFTALLGAILAARPLAAGAHVWRQGGNENLPVVFLTGSGPMVTWMMHSMAARVY